MRTTERSPRRRVYLLLSAGMDSNNSRVELFFSSAAVQYVFVFRHQQSTQKLPTDLTEPTAANASVS